MIFWNDDESTEQIRAPDDVVDILFAIDCKRIPVDHAHALATAIQQALPWIDGEPGVALHAVHVAGSQNGWERPEHGTGSFLSVSRRTRLTIRAPRHRVPDLLQGLPGTRLDLGGHTLVVGAGKVRLLSTETTLLSRYVALDPDPGAAEDEEAFLARAARALAAIDIRMRKALCGKSHLLTTPDGAIRTRSLMLAGLSPDESVRLQQRGLGAYPLLGCGIFIPHKGIDPVTKLDR